MQRTAGANCSRNQQPTEEKAMHEKEYLTNAKKILSPEYIFQFLKDSNDQRRKDIQLERAVEVLSMDYINLN